MEKIINLQLTQIILAYLFVVILLAILRKRGIPRDKEVIIACIRMSLQLLMTGYILTFIFENKNVIFVVIAIAIMETFAVFNIFKRIKLDLSKELKKIISISMVLGTLIGMLYFSFVVIRLDPWYEPRYIIPMIGMMIGNSMTGIALAMNRLMDSIKSEQILIENALMLGATPKMACKKIINSSFDAALMPTINSMVGMGIVFLPGMMTGQVMAGVLPVTAIKYQIVIMLGILGSVSLTVYFSILLGYKTFFNEDSQLII